MRRKIKKLKNVITPDPKFNNPSIAKLINYVMKDGKKTIAQKIVYKSFDIIAEKTKKDPVEIFNLAVKNASPFLELKSVRIGGANYQVPMEVRGEKKFTLAINWMLEAARARDGRPMAERFAAELIDASNNTGTAIKKKLDTHKMAEANRAFAHFAW